MAAKMLTSSEVADRLGVEAKVLRKFLRQHLPEDAQPGKGGRYEFKAGEMRTLEKAFRTWQAEHTRAVEE